MSLRDIYNFFADEIRYLIDVLFWDIHWFDAHIIAVILSIIIYFFAIKILLAILEWSSFLRKFIRNIFWGTVYFFKNSVSRLGKTFQKPDTYDQKNED